ncbi:MAG: hypothetical protein HXM95_01895 [Parvimonas micra]|nr:hypothetical protein [Parvimonas micra]
MRDIKFRAFLKSNQLMYDVLTLDIIDNKVLINNEEKQLRGYVKYQDVELMQYTGLKDKNGKEIYEGDIVEAWSEGKKAIGKVKQRIDGLWLMYPAWQSGKSWGLMPNEERNTTVKIIGNIYENKELKEINKMIGINELKNKQDAAYRKRFERWYKKSQIEKEIEISALKGYRKLRIEIREEHDETIKLMKEDEKFIQLLKEKLPEFNINRYKYQYKGIFNITVYCDYVTITW